MIEGDNRQFDVFKTHEPIGFNRDGDVVELMGKLGQLDKVTEKTALMYGVVRDGGGELRYRCIWASGADGDGDFSGRDADEVMKKVVSEGGNWNEIVSVVVSPGDSIVMNSVDLALFEGGLVHDLREDGGLRYRGRDGDYEVELFGGKTDKQRIRLRLPETRYVGAIYSGEGTELSLIEDEDYYYGCGAWSGEEQKMVFASKLPEGFDFDKYAGDLVYHLSTERGGPNSFKSGALPELIISSTGYGALYLRREEGEGKNENLAKGVLLSEEFEGPVGIIVDKRQVQIEEVRPYFATVAHKDESVVRISGEVEVSLLGNKNTWPVKNVRYSGSLEHLEKDDIGLLKTLLQPILPELLLIRNRLGFKKD